MLVGCIHEYKWIFFLLNEVELVVMRHGRGWEACSGRRWEAHDSRGWETPCAAVESVLADLLWPFNFASSARPALDEEQPGLARVWSLEYILPMFCSPLFFD